MIRSLSALLIILLSTFNVNAQTVKTGVSVVGNTPAAISASIQSARSGVKTSFLIEGSRLNAQFTKEDIPFILQIKNHFLSKDLKARSGVDSALAVNISQVELNTMLQGILDTTKNLSMIYNSSVSRVEKKGKGWELRLRDGKKIKSDLVIDATEKLMLASMLKTVISKTIAEPSGGLFESKLYRTGLASAYMIEGTIKKQTVLPAGALIPAETENLVIVPRNLKNFQVSEMPSGQAAGILAAYCVFFRTTTKSINIRIAQGELLAFGSTLIPMADILPTDPNKVSIQRVLLSGIMKPKNLVNNGKHSFEFDTAGTVSTEDLRLPMKDIFSRSQLWFADHKKEVMTLGDAISLLMFTATRGNELSKEIEDGWVESFNFSGKFDLKKPISRKQFAVLADRYLQPFNIRVDYQGNFLS